jgi:hypothetical protein
MAEWDLARDQFDGESAKGPVPRLFCSSPTEARALLNSNTARAHKDLQRIHSRFLATENIPPSALFGFVMETK